MATFQRQPMHEAPQALEQQRRQVDTLARLLQEQSIGQWQKAIEGLVALPAAIAVGGAAMALYTVGFVTRGFEVFERSAVAATEDLERWRTEQRPQRSGGDNEVSQQPRA